jgi:BASS family bile acid:Na+ symporter
MDILINIGLPVSLAIIMLSLGVGLTIPDFTRVARRPRAFLAGALSQVVLLPLAAYGIVTAFGLQGTLAVGVMLLSLCPGGVTSNMLSKFARGDVALSVSLTAVISLASILTAPVLAAWAVAHFMGTAAPAVSVTSLALAMFVITTLPVALGVALRHAAPRLADRVEPGLSALATALFVLIVAAALVANWPIFVANLATLGPALVSLNAGLMLLGLAIAALAELGWTARKTVSIETGIQNATLGITLGTLIAPPDGTGSGFSELALPSAIYGITMYAVVVPFLWWFRRLGHG